MSWDSYVKNLTDLPGCSSCAIVAIDGFGVWAKSSGFEITADEIKNIVGSFTGAYDPRVSGLKICGTKYNLLSIVDASLHCRSGSNGLFVHKTNKACLIVGYNDGSQSGNINTKASGYAEHLKSSNF